MKKMKKALAITLMLAMVMSLSACGKKTNVMPEDPKDILAAAQANTEAFKDIDASVNVNMTMSVMGQSMSITSDMDMLVKVDPYTAKIDSQTDMGELGSQNITLYMGKEDDKYYLYTCIEDKWTKEEVDKELFETTASTYTSNTDIGKFIKDSKSFKKTGTEDINGKKAVVLEGIITGDALKELIEETESLKNVTSIAGSELNADLFDSIGDLPIKMWIDEKEVVPVKISMDMSNMMKGLFDSLLNSDESTEDLELDISECVMEITYNSYNTIKEIKIPEEALKATEAE